MFYKITPATCYSILITHENERNEKTLSKVTLFHSFNLENIKYLIKYHHKKLLDTKLYYKSLKKYHF